MAETTPDKNSCPYWSPISLKCSLCHEGLFIPLENHIEIYCRTEAYTMCTQYSLGYGSHQLAAAGDLASGNNRRRHPRILDRHRLTLVRLDRPGMPASQVATPARTIDLSPGGLRLQTAEPLVSDTVLQVSFDDLATDFPLTGTATVKWCRRLDDSADYQAGLAFTSDRMAEAMEQFLRTRHHLR